MQFDDKGRNRIKKRCLNQTFWRTLLEPLNSTPALGMWHMRVNADGKTPLFLSKDEAIKEEKTMGM
ncbi:hypothetical protein [Pseudoramibacter faecis]|uniref:hypothetical protein n=1 Tax=Pseudoramibacter faecis TaxID=3108534 RepID=UPI002E769D9D|nr:hypothetical protein [Pseudoramibacter sp. HA2172]